MVAVQSQFMLLTRASCSLDALRRIIFCLVTIAYIFGGIIMYHTGEVSAATACRHNEKQALAVGRSDLVQLWKAGFKLE